MKVSKTVTEDNLVRKTLSCELTGTDATVITPLQGYCLREIDSVSSIKAIQWTERKSVELDIRTLSKKFVVNVDENDHYFDLKCKVHKYASDHEIYSNRMTHESFHPTKSRIIVRDLGSRTLSAGQSQSFESNRLPKLIGSNRKKEALVFTSLEKHHESLHYPGNSIHGLEFHPKVIHTWNNPYDPFVSFTCTKKLSPNESFRMTIRHDILFGYDDKRVSVNVKKDFQLIIRIYEIMPNSEGVRSFYNSPKKMICCFFTSCSDDPISVKRLMEESKGWNIELIRGLAPNALFLCYVQLDGEESERKWDKERKHLNFSFSTTEKIDRWGDEEERREFLKKYRYDGDQVTVLKFLPHNFLTKKLFLVSQ